jgi:hypothetical protein
MQQNRSSQSLFFELLVNTQSQWRGHAVSIGGDLAPQQHNRQAQI